VSTRQLLPVTHLLAAATVSEIRHSQGVNAGQAESSKHSSYEHRPWQVKNGAGRSTQRPLVSAVHSESWRQPASPIGSSPGGHSGSAPAARWAGQEVPAARWFFGVRDDHDGPRAHRWAAYLNPPPRRYSRGALASAASALRAL